jgi:hypothetical protein
LSFVPHTEQRTIAEALDALPNARLDMRKAEELRRESLNGRLSTKFVIRLLSGAEKPNKLSTVKLKSEFVSRWFEPTASSEEIEAEIASALEFWRARNE